MSGFATRQFSKAAGKRSRHEPELLETPEAAARLDESVMKAASRAEWDELQRLWREQLRYTGFGSHPAAASAYADLPEEARRRYPILTWAHTLASAQSVPREERLVLVARTFLRDAVSLHADWQSTADTDAAVLAGTMWLCSQQAKPVEGSGLEEAWRTRNALAALVEARRQHGQPPADDTAALFHAKSAQLALMRTDVETAIAEADRAIMLNAGTAPVVAAGIRDLALELHGTPSASPPPDLAIGWSAPPDLLGHPTTPLRLAQAARATRILDQDDARRAFASIPDTPGEPCWPVRVGLEALAGALWKSPEEALAQLNSDIGRNSVLSMEQHYPLGRVNLIRARSVLLCKLNAPADALELAGSLARPWSWVPATRAQLWAGDLDAAIETARSGLFVDPATWNSDRVALSVLKAAAMASSQTRDPGEKKAAFARAMTACTRVDSIVSFGLLPDFALRALIDYHDETGCEDCILCHPVTRARLAELAGAGEGVGLIRLTAREAELLPLLATAAPVPDIAQRLHLSVGTVRKQVATLRAKFDAHSRQELIRRARSSGHLRAG